MLIYDYAAMSEDPFHAQADDASAASSGVPGARSAWQPVPDDGRGGVAGTAEADSSGVMGSAGTASSTGVIGSAGTVASAGVIGSAGTVASAGVVGSAGTVASAGVVGSAAVVLSAGVLASVAARAIADAVQQFAGVTAVSVSLPDGIARAGALMRGAGPAVVDDFFRDRIDKTVIDTLRHVLGSDFVRLPYTDAVERLAALGSAIEWGRDLGGDAETLLAKQYDRPVLVYNYPKQVKAFYMKENAADPRTVLNNDMLAPEGYGEIIGGSQREDDHDKLLARIREEKLPEDAYAWYLDLRKYGTFVHSGFGLGVERTVAWICGIPHIREAIAFPRTLYKLWP